jgi:DNA-binding LytR/AlgR family response regulator
MAKNQKRGGGSSEAAVKPIIDAFYLWDRNRLVRVEMEKILYVKADRCYSEIHLTDGRLFVPSMPMSALEPHLPAVGFIRIHRSFIVNRRMVEVIYGNRLFLPGEEELPVGRQYRRELMQSLVIIGTQNGKYCS